MIEQELREKIARIIAKHLCKNRYSHFQLYGDSANCYSRENFAECEAIADTVDALIAAGIGDVSEWKHRTELAEKMYSMLRDIQVEKRRCGIPTGINCLVENEDCAKCMDIYYVIEAEKELQEERKDD